MLKNITIAACIMMIVACGKNKSDQPKQSPDAAIDTVASSPDVKTGSISEIDSSGVLMIPLTLDSENDRDDKIPGYSSSGGSTNYWNIIFYNSRSREQHLLTDKKVLISEFSDDTRSTDRHLFFSVITDDFNADKVLSNDDPQYLFITDKQGNNFMQVSPMGCDVTHWEYIKASNKILMTVIKDTTHDKDFDEKDEVSIFEYEIDKSATPVEIVSESLKSQLKSLYNKDWKKVEKQ
ncbi:hypothetical protein [Mucilaginibacter terrae]|uniref:Lipoprotein n=1 Tax=Mucilaginibacter terrae TaxID=1955052 RepID=A0ABU3GPL5_9SPHI|nr:hypothetical protein [Mucilaginibacter terrae]MDT3401724.1 hypothetical protein [Mucilaginibacter terrae]